ncbi:Uncharacterised protein [Mycobacteroides abscessus subsp. abscessus]|nr:Uncharacterised protein [Mycobacteroides abscessus subsp. abscessus]
MPPAVQAGSPSPVHTSFSASSDTGLAVPSLNPNRLRPVPDGRGGELYPSMRQRICRSPRTARVISRNA